MQIADSVKNIIFDFDETIATLDINWKEWHVGVGNIFKKYEPSFDNHLKGERVEFLQNTFFEKYGPDLKKEVDDFTRDYEEKNAPRVFPVQKTIDLIKRTDGKNMYVWTSNDSKTAEKFLKELEILQKFELIIGREIVDFIKPNPSGFEKYLKDKGDKSTFLYFGNSNSDRGAAKNSGVKYIDVTEF